MDFLSWHYSIGLKIYSYKWYFALARVNHYFSLPQLLLTLFFPWKRLVEQDSLPGFHPLKEFEQLTFNLVSRGIGAFVRIVLFFTGSLVMSAVLFAGLIGFLVWLVFPFVTYPYFSNSYLLHAKILAGLTPANFLASHPGKFLLSHSGLSSLQLPKSFPPVSSLTRLLEYITGQPDFSPDKLRHFGVTVDDLLLAAHWWDKLNYQIDPLAATLSFSRAGIGQELVFGYTPQLDKYVTDYTASYSAFASHLVSREAVVNQVERSLSTGRSVLIIGQPGVGKRTVAMEFARRASGGEFGTAMSYKRVLELDYNFLLSDSFDINAKKTKLSRLLSEASAAGNVILVLRDLHRLVNPAVEGLDFTDVFESHFHRLPIIAVIAQVDYERFLAPLASLRKYFDPITIIPPTKDEALIILLNSAQRWEAQTGVIVTTPALRAIISGSDRFITEIPFPEKALELLDNIVAFAQRQKLGSVTVEHVNAVLSEKTGVPLARLTSRERDLLKDLESALHKNLVNQETAVTAIAKALRARALGVRDDHRPTGSFLFLGPTGVGKTQTAKVLSETYFGSQKYILRYDMAEYSGSEGLIRLIGSSQTNQPGSMTTAIKNRPASLLLLDEFEKSSPDVYNLFLALLDEGEITDGQNRKILCRHLFVIATSNAAAEFIREQVNAGLHGEPLQTAVLEYIQKERLFSPEFLNRFDGVVVFEPLTPVHLTQIARLLLTELQTNLIQKNLHLQITPELCERLGTDGYDPAMGARPMRRLIDLTLGDLIASAMLNDSLSEGDTFQIVSPSPKQYSLVKIN
ncbi:MAG: ATP-dependent Clp protease ATP-binding subunit ClpC [Microgenomates group bacterium Gr01-1014_16]|nr:MAG: ATP-dependent Clp protease ATP-binding subunit ClpC [Microgenomates group bacterium Gr01-1014_16]